MHYLIDGYNLLFRIMKGGEDLKHKRQEVVSFLQERAQRLDLEMTIVFDSHYRDEESSQSHFGALKIIYTAKGETADEYILHHLKELPSPSEYTVITSDKVLARRCRIRLARTEEVDPFLSWLHRRSVNKGKEQKEKKSPAQRPLRPLLKEQTPIPTPPPPQPNGGSIDYYLSLFQAEYDKLPIQERKHDKRKTKKERIQRTEPDNRLISDQERWLKAFEAKRETRDDLF